MTPEPEWNLNGKCIGREAVADDDAPTRPVGGNLEHRVERDGGEARDLVHAAWPQFVERKIVTESGTAPGSRQTVGIEQQQRPANVPTDRLDRLEGAAPLPGRFKR